MTKPVQRQVEDGLMLDYIQEQISAIVSDQAYQWGNQIWDPVYEAVCVEVRRMAKGQFDD